MTTPIPQSTTPTPESTHSIRFGESHQLMDAEFHHSAENENDFYEASDEKVNMEDEYSICFIMN